MPQKRKGGHKWKHVKTKKVATNKCTKHKPKKIVNTVIEVDASESPASFIKEMAPELDPKSIKSEPVDWEQCEFTKYHLVDYPAGEEKYLDCIASSEDDKKWHVELGTVDICEQFIDEKGVHGREEYLMKNEESKSNSSVIEVDTNQSPASFKEEISQVLDPTSIKSEPVDIEQCEFPKCHLVGEREEKYLDESIQNEHTDHTYCSKDEKKWPVKVEVIDIFEQFIDQEEVYHREDYIIKNEETYLNFLVQEGNAIQSLASFTKESPPVFDPASNKSLPLYIKKHMCHMCDFETSDEKDLESHIKSVHLSIKCDLCEYVTSGKDNLKQHVDLVHLNIKEHKCHLCEYVTNRKVCLERHIESVHLDVKKHKCHLCG